MNGNVATTTPAALDSARSNSPVKPTAASTATVADLEFWLLPLFAAVYQRWRLRHGLPATALGSPGALHPIRRVPVVLMSPRVLLPMSLSNNWPPNVHVCGMAARHVSHAAPAPPHCKRLKSESERGGGGGGGGGIHAVVSSARALGKPVVLVTMGSVERYGDTAQVASFLCSTSAALLDAGMCVLLHSDATSPKAPHEHLFVVRGAANHSMLLRDCDVAVHHGGAGTTYAVCAAGVAHAVVPVAFDQFHWARRTQELGVGNAVCGGMGAAPAAVVAAVQSAAATPRSRLDAVAAQAAQDGGQVAVTRAADVLRRMFRP